MPLAHLYDAPAPSPVAFNEKLLIAGLDYAYGLADFDNDGRLDITVSDSQTRGHAGAAVHLLRGLARTAIVRGETFPFAPTRHFVLFEEHVPIDLDGDGRPDLVIAMREQKIDPDPGRGLVWLENTGDGCRRHVIDMSARWRNTRTVQIGDIDGDGRPDVLATDFWTGHAAWFENTGTGWTHHTLPVDTRNAHFGRLVDMNGDGRLDALLPHRDGSPFSTTRPTRGARIISHRAFIWPTWTGTAGSTSSRSRRSGRTSCDCSIPTRLCGLAGRFP